MIPTPASAEGAATRRRLAPRVRNQLGPAAVAVGALANIAGEFTKDRWMWILWWHHLPVDGVLHSVGLALAALGLLATARKIDRLGVKAARADAADAAEFALVQEIRTELRGLCEDMRLMSDGRASVFLFRGDGFSLAGRYSDMSKYDRCSGREMYPTGEGVLGMAWDRGEAEELDLPDPARATRTWLARQQKMGVQAAEAASMTMRSRSYAAIRLQADRRMIGVIVVESELPTGVAVRTVSGCTEAQERISRLLDHVSAVEHAHFRAAVRRCLEQGRT